MLIFDYPEWIQPTIAQVLIPKAAYKLTLELEHIDKLLQDETFEEPIIERFNASYSSCKGLSQDDVTETLHRAEL